MKYGKLINDALEIKEFENGMEVGGGFTEQQAVEKGYKPVCEVEQPSDAEFCVYKEYDVCFVQIWKRTDEEVQKDEIWTSESETMPTFSDLERLKKDVAMVEKNINTLNLTNNEALSVIELYPEWSADHVQVKVGERYQYNNLLWEVIQAHTTQENWKPSLDTASLWKVVDKEHEGTQGDPIPYTPPMQIYMNKYYIQNGVMYKCTRDSGIPLSHNLSALVGTYVETVVSIITTRSLTNETNTIDFVPPMIIEKGKFYREGGIVYECTQTSKLPISNKLKDLVDFYVKISK